MCSHFNQFQEFSGFHINFFNDLLIFSSVLFYLHECVYFLMIPLLLVSNFIPLLSNRMQGFIFIFLYLLRFSLCLSICYILEKLPWADENNCSVDICQAHLTYDAIYHHCLHVYFCLDGLLIAENGVLKSPTIAVLVLIFGSMAKSCCFIILGTPVWCNCF